MKNRSTKLKALLFVVFMVGMAMVGTMPMIMSDSTDGGGGGGGGEFTWDSVSVLQNPYTHPWSVAVSTNGKAEFRAYPNDGVVQFRMREYFYCSTTKYVRITVYFSYNIKSTGNMQASYKLSGQVYHTNGLSVDTYWDKHIDLYKPSTDSSEVFTGSGSDYQVFTGFTWIKLKPGGYYIDLVPEAKHWAPGGYCYLSSSTSYKAYITSSVSIYQTTVEPPPGTYRVGA